MRRTVRLVIVAFAVLASQAAGAQQGALWEGTIQCPNQPITFKLVIVPGQPQARATLVVVSQNFATDVAMTMTGNELQVSGPMPGNLPAMLRGPVQGADWNLTFHQGNFRCTGAAKLAPPIEARYVAIPPAYQATPMWCWLTVGEMIFRHFSIAPPQMNSGAAQCAIMQTVYQGSPQYAQCAQNCAVCAQLGANSSREFAGMLTDLPRRLSALQHQAVPRLFVATTSVLSASEVKAELDANRPVAIGISPSGMPTMQQMGMFFTPQHVALIVGMVRVNGNVWYRVNDPFPFHMFNMPVPYVAHGGFPQVNVGGGPAASVAYWITDTALKAKLRWTESFLVRHDGQHVPVR